MGAGRDNEHAHTTSFVIGHVRRPARETRHLEAVDVLDRIGVDAHLIEELERHAGAEIAIVDG